MQHVQFLPHGQRAALPLGRAVGVHGGRQLPAVRGGQGLARGADPEGVLARGGGADPVRRHHRVQGAEGVRGAGGPERGRGRGGRRPGQHGHPVRARHGHRHHRRRRRRREGRHVPQARRLHVRRLHDVQGPRPGRQERHPRGPRRPRRHHARRPGEAVPAGERVRPEPWLHRLHRIACGGVLESACLRYGDSVSGLSLFFFSPSPFSPSSTYISSARDW